MNMTFRSRPEFVVVLSLLALCFSISAQALERVIIPDTGQSRCYNDSRAIKCPGPGKFYYGQDAQYQGSAPAYEDNGDGTITDLNTGLMWSKAVSPDKTSLEEAHRMAKRMNLGGYTDWRVPNIKELYSLIDFRGYAGHSERSRSGQLQKVPANAIPFINTDFFGFLYGASRERYIDAQWLSDTRYVGTVMNAEEALFGVNFADGRIKGYAYKHSGGRMPRLNFYVRFVRGDRYGENDYEDNRDGTVTDRSTGLMWAKIDSGEALDWKAALAYAENLDFAGYSDWRLPNAKELQYIVDYRRSPDTTNSPAIDPLFQSTAIENEMGELDYPAYWTSTTHLDGPRPGSAAVYVAFGRAIGQMQGRIMDVHGAGAQRSDPKTGRAQIGRGPQGDAVRIKNFVRVVRGGAVSVPGTAASRSIDRSGYPYNVNYSSGGALSANKRSVDRVNRIQGMSSVEFAGHFVRRLDRDGDGRVSRDEFDGPPDRFGVHDDNGDGFLSEDEAPPPPPRGSGPSR